MEPAAPANGLMSRLRDLKQQRISLGCGKEAPFKGRQAGAKALGKIEEDPQQAVGRRLVAAHGDQTSHLSH